uniref:Uncharacterized protein n=2 Tax=Tanacetum cinerariifolium TaxID=118510 RepID=A0A6L2MUD6_TANCI|nr:hypothetical protein [Tanacetum cinerariifolium]
MALILFPSKFMLKQEYVLYKSESWWKVHRPTKRMYVDGKVAYVDNIDVDRFNVDSIHLFVEDLGLVVLQVEKEDSVSVDEVNVNLNVNDHGLDDNYEFPVQDNYNVNDYPMEENAEKGRGEEQPDEIVAEKHVIDEVEVNMEGFNITIREKGVDSTVTPHLDVIE